MISRKIEKTISIALFTVAFLAGSVLLPYTSIFALASKQPGFDMQVRNVSNGENFAGNPTSVSLEAGEVAQMRMQINNPEKGNDIDSLRVKTFFNADANPNKFHTAVKADNLDWIGANVSVSVPTGYFLEYVSGSTVIDLDDRPEFMTRTNIDDINGTTPLAFADGYEVTNLKGGPNTWMWVYFKVKATETKPTVINPRLDLEKVVANTSKGQTLKEDRTSTTANPGDTIVFQITVKNGIAQSVLNNVVIKDQEPKGSKTPQTLKATASSDEATSSKKITVNIKGGQDIRVISGSVVLKDMFGKTIKKLSDKEVDKLFGQGLKLNDIHGTFEFAKVIEYKVKVTTPKVKSVTDIKQLPDTGPGLVLLLAAATVPAGVFIKRLKTKI